MAQIRRLFSELWKRLKLDRPPPSIELSDGEVIPVVVLDDATDDEWEDVFWSSGEVNKAASETWYLSKTFPTGYEYKILGLVFELFGSSGAGDALQGVRFIYQPAAGTAMTAMMAQSTVRTGMVADLIGSNVYRWQWPNNLAGLGVYNGLREVSYRAQENVNAVFGFDWQFLADATVGTRGLRMTIALSRRRLFGKLD